MMKNKMLAGLGVMATTTALLAATVPAASAAPGDTATTFTVTGGTIAMTVPASVGLGSVASGTGSITGNLGTITVTDDRGGTAGWTAQATSTSFTNTTTTSTEVLYTPGTVATTGTTDAAAQAAKVMSPTVAAATVVATAVTGNNTASWNPAIKVTLPSNNTAGTYTGTVNNSLL